MPSLRAPETRRRVHFVQPSIGSCLRTPSSRAHLHRFCSAPIESPPRTPRDRRSCMPSQSSSYIEVHHCPHCTLAQFRTVSGPCRRCRLPLNQFERDSSVLTSMAGSHPWQAPLATRIGKAVRRLRQERQLTQDSLALKTRTARSYVSRLENGLVGPTISTLERVASALDIDVTDLFVAARIEPGQ